MIYKRSTALERSQKSTALEQSLSFLHTFAERFAAKYIDHKKESEEHLHAEMEN